MARPQGDKASRTGRATGKGKIRATIAKGFQPHCQVIEGRESETFDLPIKLRQLFVEGKSSISRSDLQATLSVFGADLGKSPYTQPKSRWSRLGLFRSNKRTKTARTRGDKFHPLSVDNFIPNGGLIV
jgi:hypothetical protein